MRHPLARLCLAVVLGWQMPECLRPVEWTPQLRTVEAHH